MRNPSVPVPLRLCAKTRVCFLTQGLVSLLQLVVVVGWAYHYLLLLGAALGRCRNRTTSSSSTSFAILIPAHEEETVIGETVSVLKAQDYPSDLFDVHVVADHCSDRTAAVAQAHGAIAHRRDEGPRGRKAYALRWLIGRVLTSPKRYDAVAVFDADSRVHPHFLRHMARALSPDQRVLQGRHVIANPEEGVFAGLAAVDMRLNNLLRNRAKQNLGLSCRLMGDAMCFGSDVLHQHGWPADSLGEDREYGLYLLSQGVRVGYVPDAISYGQAAPTWSAAADQRVRWYGGVSQIKRRFSLDLLLSGFRLGRPAMIDQAVELLLPPFSALTLLSAALAGVQLFWRALRPLLPRRVSLAVAATWVALPFLGLWIDHAPAPLYRVLLYSPFYLAWRLIVGLKAQLQGDRVRWVRTRRQEEIDHRASEV